MLLKAVLLLFLAILSLSEHVAREHSAQTQQENPGYSGESLPYRVGFSAGSTKVKERSVSAVIDDGGNEKFDEDGDAEFLNSYEDDEDNVEKEEGEEDVDSQEEDGVDSQEEEFVDSQDELDVNSPQDEDVDSQEEGVDSQEEGVDSQEEGVDSQEEEEEDVDVGSQEDETLKEEAQEHGKDGESNTEFLLGSRLNITRSKRVPTSVKQIIDPDDVMPVETLLDIESLTSRNLAHYVGHPDDNTLQNLRKGLNFLAKYDVILNERACPQCNGQMSLTADSSRKNDKFTWRCSSCRKAKTVKKISVRKDSFFEGLRIPFQTVLFLAAEWIENPSKPVRDVARSFKIDKNTVSEIHEWFRDLTQQWFTRTVEEEGGLKLGGKGKIVEIDETVMFRAKYNRGAMLSRPPIWVFGLLERGTNNIAMFPVRRRNAATLLPLIQQHVLPHTTIISDSWRAYNGIGTLQQQYKHMAVNHKLNFVDSGNAMVHTQGIEASWGALKRSLKSRFGDKEYLIHGHLFNYMFRRVNNREKLLNRLIIEMHYYAKQETRLVPVELYDVEDETDDQIDEDVNAVDNKNDDEFVSDGTIQLVPRNRQSPSSSSGEQEYPQRNSHFSGASNSMYTDDEGDDNDDNDEDDNHHNDHNDHNNDNDDEENENSSVERPDTAINKRGSFIRRKGSRDSSGSRSPRPLRTQKSQVRSSTRSRSRSPSPKKNEARRRSDRLRLMRDNMVTRHPSRIPSLATQRRMSRGRGRQAGSKFSKEIKRDYENKKRDKSPNRGDRPVRGRGSRGGKILRRLIGRSGRGS